MKTIRPSIILSCALVLSACASLDLADEVRQFDIHFGQSVNVPFSMSSMLDTIRYIPIDSSYTVGNIDEVKYMADHYYLCDRRAGKIFQVDGQGRVRLAFCHKGHARGEYVELTDFDVDPRNGNIIVYDAASRKFLTYTSSGRYLSHFACPNVVRDFLILASGDYLLYAPDYNNGSRRGLWLTDSEGGFKRQLVSISDDFRCGGLYPNYLVRIDNRRIGLMGGEDQDNIYAIDGEQVMITCHLNFDIRIPEKLRKQENLDYNEHKGEIYTKNNYMETERWMMLFATDMEHGNILIHDKKRGATYQLAREEDLKDDMGMFGLLAHVSDNRMIHVLYASTITAYPRLRKRFPNIKTHSNPVLVVADLKR